MAATLLQIVDRAWDEMDLGSTPSTVISNTDNAVKQMLNLLNGIGLELVREHEWQAITKEYRFTTVYYTYTADLTLDNTTISTLSSTTGLTSTPTYFMVTGEGIPEDTFLVSVNAGAFTAVLSRAPTATATTVSLTFSQVIYAMPSDYDRLVDQTQWDKDAHWQLLGPTSGQGWQWMKAGVIATGPRVRFRVLADKFQLWPPLGVARYLGFEYVRNQWVTATGGSDTSKTSFTVDTDTCIFPDRLMIESLKLRMARAGGFEWLLKTYQPRDIASGFACRILDNAKASDAAAPLLSMAPRPTARLLGDDNIPDGGYGG